MDEGININKGLFTIARVIKDLSSNAPYIPYRETIITSILKGIKQHIAVNVFIDELVVDSLSKQNYVVLLACINPTIEDMTETTQTLDFAVNAKRMRNRPEVNQIIQQFKVIYLITERAVLAYVTFLCRNATVHSSLNDLFP